MSFRPDERYRLAAADDIDSPALLVFPAVIAQNLDRVLELTRTPDGHCLRPHIKTVKCAEVAALALERGILDFKCSTVSEGELLGAAGARSALLSYQLSAVKARRWRRLVERFPATRFASLVDNADSARWLSDTFADRPQDVYVDLNVGMNRTGIAPASAPALLEGIAGLPGLRLRGFHVYDGHNRAPELADRQRTADAIYATVDALRRETARHFTGPPQLVVGGSPSFRCYVGRPDVTVSPGTFFLWDAGYGGKFPDLPFEPAALLLTRVVSVVSDRILCFDLGSKAVATDPAQPRMVFPTLGPYEIIGQHEEHLTVRVPDTAPFRVGDPHLAVPVHVCPTVNLYERLLPIVDGRQLPPWAVVARDRKITV